MNEKITYSPELQRIFDLWQRSADSNDVAARFELAKFFIKSKNRDLQKRAFSTFKKLATQDYTPVQTDAKYMLGVCYENGYGIQKSYPRAIRWYKMARDNIGHDLRPLQKDFEKEMQEALHAFFGEPDTDPVTPEMIDVMIDAAEGGDVNAQKSFMELFEYSSGQMKLSGEEADYWSEKAIENGNVDMIDKLGRMYYFGQGVERDLRKGRDLMLRAAEMGSASSAYHLGIHYEKMGANKKAAEWFRLYAEREIKRRNRQLGWKAR